ncbi:hypothetical protein NDU88_006403 [Pleurodeles waltl]|uniref:Uncharacterized protein n=1 Tax=Pleurodeles waltl TaxID=8319 RepID=A0AAV7UMC6_PLEWA|nr:hypothetical protein NDU88_006403 [Pleurodeles waltl]
MRRCDGSDRADPHTISTGADATWDDPEVPLRSTHPIGSGLSPREPGKSKGQVAEMENGGWSERIRKGGYRGPTPKTREAPGVEKTPRAIGTPQEQSKSGARNPRGPNPGRRQPAPGSRTLGPATLQEKRN